MSAQRKPHRPARAPALAPAHQAAFTFALLALWLLLMCYGVLLQIKPQWLQNLSRPGIRTECRDYKNYGDDLVRQGKYPLAIAQYRKSLSIDPDQVPVKINLAVAYRDSGDMNQAATILTEAREHETSPFLRATIDYNLGQLREKEGNNAEALHHYQEALQCQAVRDRVYVKLGRLYIAAEQYAPAREAYEQALRCRLDPAFEYLRMLEQSAAAYKDNPTHVTVIEQQLMQGLGPQDLEPYDLATIQQVEQRGQEMASIYDHLGLLCVYLGDRDAAIEYFERSLEAYPDNENTRHKLQALRQPPTTSP